jgi:hypothetical protein
VKVVTPVVTVKKAAMALLPTLPTIVPLDELVGVSLLPSVNVIDVTVPPFESELAPQATTLPASVAVTVTARVAAPAPPAVLN